MAIKPNYQKDGDNVVAVQTSKDPIEQQILAAGNLSEAQVEAIRGFQRRKGLTFGEAAIALGLVRRDSLFLALSKRYNYPVLNFGVDEGRAFPASWWSATSRSAPPRKPSAPYGPRSQPDPCRRARTRSP
jgi:hypothetical protein